MAQLVSKTSPVIQPRFGPKGQSQHMGKMATKAAGATFVPSKSYSKQLGKGAKG